MKKTLAFLLASAACGTIVSLPVWGAGALSPARHDASILRFDPQEDAPLLLVSGDDDDDDDDDDEYRESDDNDDEDSYCEDDDDEVDDGCAGGFGQTAATGAVAPPQNGLFGSGAAPQAAVK